MKKAAGALSLGMLLAACSTPDPSGGVSVSPGGDARGGVNAGPARVNVNSAGNVNASTAVSGPGNSTVRVGTGGASVGFGLGRFRIGTGTGGGVRVGF